MKKWLKYGITLAGIYFAINLFLLILTAIFYSSHFVQVFGLLLLLVAIFPLKYLTTNINLYLEPSTIKFILFFIFDLIIFFGIGALIGYFVGRKK